MKQFLIPEEGRFYKANLHCHTTFSDGRATPEEIKEIYKSHGYSVVAFTDHNIQVPHPELADPDFLPLTGVEYNINDEGYPGKERDVKTTHLCLIALRDDIRYQVCYTDSYVHHGGARSHIPESMINPDEPDFERRYCAECANAMIKAGRDAGYFVTYNHPSWSQENWSHYMKLEGLSAMEIVNFGCLNEGYDDYNSRVYRDMLCGGKRLFCIAADDNHNKYPVGHPRCDALGGWVMIKAEKLEYNVIGKALEDGNFYSSTGPEIRSLWFEDGKICADFSPAVAVDCITGVKKCFRAGRIGGEPFTHAEFDLKPWFRWIRLRIIDREGNAADTNAYFTDSLAF